MRSGIYMKQFDILISCEEIRNSSLTAVNSCKIKLESILLMALGFLLIISSRNQDSVFV